MNIVCRVPVFLSPTCDCGSEFVLTKLSNWVAVFWAFYIGGVIKVVRLMDEVESLFIKHFADNDRKKAMKFLRPQQQKDSHMVTFFVGKFFSSFFSPDINALSISRSNVILRIMKQFECRCWQCCQCYGWFMKF